MTTTIAFAGCKEMPKALFIYKIFGQKPHDNIALQYYRASRIYDFLMHPIEIWDVSIAAEIAMMKLRDTHDIVVVCFDVNTNLKEVKQLTTFLAQQPYAPHLVIFGIVVEGRRVHPLAVHALANRLKTQKNFATVTVVEENCLSSDHIERVLQRLVVMCRKGIKRY